MNSNALKQRLAEHALLAEEAPSFRGGGFSVYGGRPYHGPVLTGLGVPPSLLNLADDLGFDIVEFVEAIPEGAKIETAPDRWVLWLLEGLLARVKTCQKIVPLFRRRLEGKEPKASEWRLFQKQPFRRVGSEVVQEAAGNQFLGGAVSRDLISVTQAALRVRKVKPAILRGALLKIASEL